MRTLERAGFLSTEDSSAPGNYAILDLVAALHWIKENVAAFGGDADQVSLLGHGYGAALVNILLVSPITKGMWILSVCNCLRRITGLQCTTGPRVYVYIKPLSGIKWNK